MTGETSLRNMSIEQMTILQRQGEANSSTTDLATLAAVLNTSLGDRHPAERLKRLCGAVGGRIVLSTGFGLEGQVLFHLIAENELDIDVITLDTGRLFPEAYALWAATERRYGRRIAAIYPDATQVEALVIRQGINGFYESTEARQACCQVRKVEPLARALAGATAWVTGMRADQSRFRNGTPLAAFDADRGILKFNPLFDWSREAVLSFARQWDIPVNPLHQAGYPSIGCAPCTRAIRAGEPERAGRWWWEAETKKECGLHLDQRAALAPQDT
jgi:phosphoadenosine phosphosulfate reductase